MSVWRVGLENRKYVLSVNNRFYGQCRNRHLNKHQLNNDLNNLNFINDRFTRSKYFIYDEK